MLAPSHVMRVAAVRTRLLLIAPIRIGLAVALLGASFAGDEQSRSLGLAFLVGAAFITFAALADRRSLLLRGSEQEPEPLPAGAAHDPYWRIALTAALPSTIGLSVLSVISLAADNQVLGALLAGAVLGLGIATVIGLFPLLAWERERSVRLYVGPHGRRYVD
jgi:hypothetical protein